ncbi:hypothetical protein B7R76_06685 [Mageeibacillus indolicus]|uniref:Uncharacterized protein n=2 Tax=Mageeibacillus indolicus TaxID=884684 RepID=A0A2J8AZS9_9FIRM|nr:hypothetical protein B7R76_06685 [Mageeibacillus indolicus]
MDKLYIFNAAFRRMAKHQNHLNDPQKKHLFHRIIASLIIAVFCLPLLPVEIAQADETAGARSGAVGKADKTGLAGPAGLVFDGTFFLNNKTETVTFNWTKLDANGEEDEDVSFTSELTPDDYQVQATYPLGYRKVHYTSTDDDKLYAHGDKFKVYLTNRYDRKITPETVSTVQLGADGKLHLKFILGQNNIAEIEKTLELQLPSGIDAANLPSLLSTTFKLDGKPVKLTARRKGNGTAYVAKISCTVDKTGQLVVPTIEPDLSEIGRALMQVNLGRQKVALMLKSIRQEGDKIIYQIEKVLLGERHFTLRFETPFHIIPDTQSGETHKFEFAVAGRDVRQKVSFQSQVGPLEIPVTLQDVPLEGEITVKQLPEHMQLFYGINAQSYDARSQTLTLKLGRNVLVNFIPLPYGKSYNDLAELLKINRFSLLLYNERNELVQQSRLMKGFVFNTKINGFSGLLPGNYYIKIDQAKLPIEYKDYVTDKRYDLEVAKDGDVQLSTYRLQPDGAGKYEVAHSFGAPLNQSGSRGKLFHAIKIPLIQFINQGSEPNKEILVESGKAEQQREVAEGETVNYQITLSILPDHNVVAKSIGDIANVNMGTWADLSFTDKLDNRLEYLPNTLKVTVDGNPTKEYVAEYVEAEHSIKLQDQSKPQVIPFGFNDKFTLKDKIQTLKVSFTAKVKWNNNFAPLINRVGNSETTLFPPLELKVNKSWQGGTALLKNYDQATVLSWFEVIAQRNKQTVATYRADTLLKPNSFAFEAQPGGGFSFVLHNLPRFTAEDLKKPLGERVNLTYTIRENLPAELQDFHALNIVNAAKPAEITLKNVYTVPGRSLKLTKKWDERVRAVAEKYVPIFTLTQTAADGRKREFTFSKQQLRLMDGAQPYTYRRFKVENNVLTEVTVAPNVEYDRDEFKLSDLPQTDAAGKAYRYSVDETGVQLNGVDVKAQFAAEIKSNDGKISAGGNDNGNGDAVVIYNKYLPPVPSESQPPVPSESQPPVPSESQPPEPPTEPQPKTGEHIPRGMIGLMLLGLALSVGVIINCSRRLDDRG